MSIRAKFRVHSVSQENAESQSVRLHPVYTGSDENKSFSKFTPSGELQMSITNPAAQGFFVNGREYYLDITPADPPAES